MVWWKRFFKKKTEPVEEDDWEQVVYTRNGVNFEEEDQRKRYIVNCLEQITEASCGTAFNSETCSPGNIHW